MKTKQIIATILSGLMIVSFASCGEKTNADNNKLENLVKDVVEVKDSSYQLKGDFTFGASLEDVETKTGLSKESSSSNNIFEKQKLKVGSKTYDIEKEYYFTKENTKQDLCSVQYYFKDVSIDNGDDIFNELVKSCEDYIGSPTSDKITFDDVMENYKSDKSPQYGVSWVENKDKESNSTIDVVVDKVAEDKVTVRFKIMNMDLS